MSRHGLLAMAITLSVGCGGEELGGIDPASVRGGGGKADSLVDQTLSCQGSCGGLASNSYGYCGCDEACASFGDCCQDKQAVCDDQPEAIVITQKQNGSSMTVARGDTIDVQLEGNPTTGYAWKLLASSRSFPLQQEEYVQTQPDIGGGGTFHFYFTADTFSVGGSFELRFAYYRSWEGVDAASETFTVTIVVTPEPADCQAIDSDYQAEVPSAAACATDAECQTFLGGTLSCGFPNKAINQAHAGQLQAYREAWQDLQCQHIDWNCPLLSMIPPWYKTLGVCEQGSCQIKYIDTRTEEP